jgi:hypothetical protein
VSVVKGGSHGTSLAMNRAMKLAGVISLLLVGCSTAAPKSTATGIPGDTSVDDPGAPPAEPMGGKSDAPLEQITYQGGVVVRNPTIVNVYWGSYWNTDQGISDRAVIDGFSSQIGHEAWWKIMAEYPDKVAAPAPLTMGAPLVVTDSEPGTKLYAGDVAIHQLLAAKITSGELTYDPETFFVVYPGDGTTGVRGECGHHWYYSANLPEGRRKILYALVPYLPDTDVHCGVGKPANGNSLDEMTVTLSHEIAETVTDPYTDAWDAKDGNEVGDQCDGGYVASWGGEKYAVQDIWSNAKNACIHIE